MPSMKFAGMGVAGAILLCLPMLLGLLAIPRFVQGVRAEGFRSTIDRAHLGTRLSTETYRSAAEALTNVPPDDGRSLTARAQVLALSAPSDSKVLALSRALVVSAIQDGPSNPDGWLLLCQIDAQLKPTDARSCLEQAFALAPYDWFTADRRMLLAANEWPYLSERLRDRAVGLVLPMWSTLGWSSGYNLRGALYDLSFTDNGRQLLRAGFAGHRDDLRDFNRYIIEENSNAR